MAVKINISIDDVSPHPLSSIKCLDRCFSLIKTYPSIKFTLFIPTCYQRNPSEQQYNLLQYPAFIQTIKKLSPNNFEIAYHGHIHGNKKWAEFATLGYKDSLNRLKISEDIFKQLGVTPMPFFRPPAYYLTPDGFNACKNFGIKVLALHPGPRYKEFYHGEDEGYDRVIYSNDFSNDNSDLILAYHACEWDGSYFNALQEEIIRKRLESREQEYEFCFMKEWTNNG